MEVKTTSRYRSNRQGEIDGAAVYRAMASAEKSPQLASVYTRLAEVESRHLDFWEAQLGAIGVDPGPRRPSWRGRALCFLRLCASGANAVLPVVATLEQDGQTFYDDQPETAGTQMRAQGTARTLGRFAMSRPVRPKASLVRPSASSKVVTALRVVIHFAPRYWERTMD